MVDGFKAALLLLYGPASRAEVALTATAAGWNGKDAAGKDTKLWVVELLISPPAQNIAVVLHCMILSQVHLDFVRGICHRYIFPLLKVNCSLGPGPSVAASSVRRSLSCLRTSR